LALRIGEQFLVLNDVSVTDQAWIEERAQRTGLKLLGVVPSDGGLRQLSLQGEALSQLAPDSTARRALREILEAALSPAAATL